MNRFLILAFLFFIGCVVGWGIEVFYRRFSPDNKERKWINPGFLTGPYLPLYGFGLCALYLIANVEGSFIMERVTVGGKLILFLIMAIVMTVLEYIAGLIFIKGMNIKLWDYSNEKFNLQGIICLKFSFYWGILGAVYFFLIHPHILDALQWFSHNLAFSFVVGVFFGVFFVDLGYSLGVMKIIRRFAVENQILVRYEDLKMQIRANAAEKKEKIRFIFSFKSMLPLKEHLYRYIELSEAFSPTSKELADKWKV